MLYFAYSVDSELQLTLRSTEYLHERRNCIAANGGSSFHHHVRVLRERSSAVRLPLVLDFLFEHLDDLTHSLDSEHHRRHDHDEHQQSELHSSAASFLVLLQDAVADVLRHVDTVATPSQLLSEDEVVAVLGVLRVMAKHAVVEPEPPSSSSPAPTEPSSSCSSILTSTTAVKSSLRDFAMTLGLLPVISPVDCQQQQEQQHGDNDDDEQLQKPVPLGLSIEVDILDRCAFFSAMDDLRAQVRYRSS